MSSIKFVRDGLRELKFMVWLSCLIVASATVKRLFGRIANYSAKWLQTVASGLLTGLW
ncbi:MAG TPA: hypothetical protein VGH37_16615 [Candidatus Acidoferrum sp.]